MNSFKRNTSTFIVVASVFAFSAAIFPSKVQAQSFNVQNVFSSLTSTIEQQFRKVYLALPGDKSAEAVLEQSTNAMKNVATVEYDTQVDATLLQGETELVRLDLDVSGPTVIEDMYQPSTAQQESHLTAQLVMEGTTMSADADIKVDGKIVYVKANQVPSIPFLQIGEFKDRWIRFDSESVEGEADTELTSEQRAELEVLYIDFIQSAELSQARKESVDGNKVFVIDITVTGEDLAQLARQVAEIQGADVTSEDVESMQQAFEQLEDLTATIMVDRSSYYVRQLVVPLTFNIPEEAKTDQVANQILPADSFEEADTLQVDVTMLFTEYNQPVEFSLPADAQNADEVFTQVMGGSTLMNLDQEELPEGIGAEDLKVLTEVQPIEVPELSVEEKALLEQYGIEL